MQQTTTTADRIGLTGYGRYLPDNRLTGEEVADASGLPEEVVIEKMGLTEKRVCSPDADHCTDMGVKAAEKAIAAADIDADSIDVVHYHGSEYKDYYVWSAAANITERIGADNAYATETYALCAGCPLVVKEVRAQLLAGDIDRALLVTASREEDLIDYENTDSSFMFNFGSGAAAYILEADPDPDRTSAWVRAGHAVTDGSFSNDVVMHGGGSRNPPTHETIDENLHTLDVPDPDGMKERLAPVSLPNYLDVADTALERSGYTRDDIDFVAVTHMKRSFHELLLSELGVDPDADGYYLDEYGHVQSADQILALDEGVESGRVEPGDLVLFLGAGTGYTWSAAVLEWEGKTW